MGGNYATQARSSVVKLCNCSNSEEGGKAVTFEIRRVEIPLAPSVYSDGA